MVVVVVVWGLLLLEVGTPVGGTVSTDHVPSSLVTAPSLLQVSGCWCGPGGIVSVVVVVWMVLSLDVEALVGETISADHVPCTRRC